MIPHAAAVCKLHTHEREREGEILFLLSLFSEVEILHEMKQLQRPMLLTRDNLIKRNGAFIFVRVGVVLIDSKLEEGSFLL